ncbi:hypothetical protein SAMN04489724_3339 [Algoriphagus locisalis]|uniref:Uncharacterized protein n=1 Tax=Algoriphagus locisalis TaxID=305507 RepID=A0A1I7CQZ1_9BACT|nr:hypothetical protein [Algoriphagus locisalis]SFU01843.1 hypothetical protein SAMN04489724_3339 [Algoriphagus locisalis]
MTGILNTGDDFITAYSSLADWFVIRARWGDAAAVLSAEGGSQAVGLRVEALLASWPFGFWAKPKEQIKSSI